MDSAYGTVTTVTGNRAAVAVDTAAVCPRCAEGRGCGAGIFQPRNRQRVIEVDIPGGMRITAGDAIAVTIGPRSLLKATLYAYGLPLAGMLGALLLASLLLPAPGDLAYVVAASTGLCGGFLLGRRQLRKKSLCREFLPDVQNA